MYLYHLNLNLNLNYYCCCSSFLIQDMLVCIDICLRELVNLPGSQKLIKKKHANLLRSFIVSKKWKVAGGEYREKDIKEILQAEGWDEM